MNRYQLAKIVDWAGTLHSRKRMQKVVYLLQVAGCPLGADYILHHYGPYSHEVARLTDEMGQAGLLVEHTGANQVGQQYSYEVADRTRASVAAFEATPEGREASKTMAAFKERVLGLLKADLKDLEVASTIVYFKQQGHDWPIAVDKACDFKGLTKQSPAVHRAEALARGVFV